MEVAASAEGSKPALVTHEGSNDSFAALGMSDAGTFNLKTNFKAEAGVIFAEGADVVS